MKYDMNVLELFCGTKSISKAFVEVGFRSVTLDNISESSPDICMDILEWDYKQSDLLKKYQPTVIWASPPCGGFSLASVYRNWMKQGEVRTPVTERAVLAIKLVKKAIEIIKYFQPDYWFIENPRAMLRVQPFMKGLPRQTITYCQYGDKRMKPTDIWGIFPKDFPIRICGPRRSCHVAAPRGSTTGTQGMGTIEGGRIPYQFCYLLATHIVNEVYSRFFGDDEG